MVVSVRLIESQIKEVKKGVCLIEVAVKKDSNVYYKTNILVYRLSGFSKIWPDYMTLFAALPRSRHFNQTLTKIIFVITWQRGPDPQMGPSRIM